MSRSVAVLHRGPDRLGLWAGSSLVGGWESGLCSCLGMMTVEPTSKMLSFRHGVRDGSKVRVMILGARI